MRIKLIGSKANRDAIGAVVTLRAAGQSQTRHVTPTRSYLSQSETTLTFGLGTATAIESVEILWPGQVSQSIQSPTIDKLAVIEQPR